jgi:PAS domain-containing protein
VQEISVSIDVNKVLIQELMDDSADISLSKIDNRVLSSPIRHRPGYCFGLENPTDAVGKTDSDLFLEKREYAQRFYLEEQIIMETRQLVFRQEWMVSSTATKEIIWLSESKLPISDESGSIIGLFGLGRDITVRKKAHSYE